MWLFDLFFPKFRKSDIEVRMSRIISESPVDF